MPNAAATVLPWNRLPSVSEQMTRSRISRSPAADSSTGLACTATARLPPVRVTRSGHGGGMPGSCWSSMQVRIPREDHNKLTFRSHRGDGFPSSQGVPARPNPAARRPVRQQRGGPGGTRLRACWIAEISTSAPCRSTPRSGPGFNQRLLEICVPARAAAPRATHVRSAASYAEISDQLGAPVGSIGPTPVRAWLSCASSCKNMSRASRRLLTGHPRS